MNPSTPDVRKFEVASPESLTTQTGTTGVSTSARVDAPEKIDVAPQGVAGVAAVEGSPSVRLDGSGLVLPEAAAPTGELIKGSLARASHTSGPNGHRPDCGDSQISSEGGDGYRATPPLPHGLIVNEHLALVTDEGANSSNAWRLHEHVQHGLDRLARRVEGVLLRAKVIEPEFAEVGQ